MDWMWAQASDLLDQAERMHRRLFHLAPPGLESLIWEPPVDVFESERELIVVVALPGVPNDQVEVLPEPGELLVRAQCRIPFTADQCAVCRLEIPYGRFERRIAIPPVRPDTLKSEFRDGYLIMQFEKFNQV
jgi:HSP20 family molecular chaperone IbpA